MSKKHKAVAVAVKAPFYIRCWEFLARRRLKTVSAILTFLIPFIIYHAHSDHLVVQQNFAVMSSGLSDVSNATEPLYIDCHDHDVQSLESDVTLLRADLKTFLNEHRAQGKLEARKTYCDIHEFTHWADQLQNAGYKHVCSLTGDLSPRSESQITIERNEMLADIETEQKLHHGPIAMFADYFSRARYQLYKPSDCLAS